MAAVEIPRRVLGRIWAYIDVGELDECWPWLRSIGSHGYGQIGWGAKGEKRRAVTAHRAAWTAVNGPIPGRLTVDHLCRNRVCCNPAHLRLLTNSENASDNGYKRRTSCPQGHPYDEANTYVNAEGHRSCRECNRIRSRGRDRRTGVQRAPIFGRSCAECGGAIAPEKRAHAIYCSSRCASAPSKRAYKARKRAERSAS